MFYNTQAHKDYENEEYTIRIGKTIPSDAVGLAYFHNKILNNDEGVLISEAPKLTIDHMTAEYIMKKFCVPNQDMNYFPTYYYYSDNNGYSGELPIENTEWIEHVHFQEVDHEEVRVYEVNEKIIPVNTIKVVQGHLTGMIGATAVIFEPIEYAPTTTKTELTKKVSKTISQNDKATVDFSSLPATQSYNKDGYSGTLRLIETSKRAIPSIKNSSAYLDIITQTQDKAYIDKNGKRYYKLKTIKKLEHKKAFGTMRYWGPQRNGICGNDGSRFSTKTPKHQPDMYCPNQIKYLKGKSSGSPHHDLGGASSEWWNLSYGNTTSHWTYDYALADKIVGSGNHNRGNAWIVRSDTVKKAFSQIGTPQNVAKYLRCEKIHDPNKVGYKTLTYKTYGKIITSTAQAYNSLWYRSNSSGPGNQVTKSVTKDIMRRRPGVIASSWNVYFRDIISFYRGVITSSSTKYACNVITANGIKFNIEADYEGIVKKVITDNSSKPVKWKAYVTYSGTLSGTLNDWNGIVTYKGTVTKRNVIGNINPVGSNTLIMYPDNEGYLTEDFNNKQSSNVESELFRVTDMFKEGVPLFYSYRLKFNVYSVQEPNEFGVLDNDNIVLMDELRNKLDERYKYKARYTKTSIKNVYSVDIYTNFENNSGKKIYCSYIGYDESKISKVNSEIFEQIFVQPAFQRGIEYTNEEVHKQSRKNKIKITKPSIIEDNRRKINFEYIVDKIVDGEIVESSAPIKAKGINIRYALDNEKNYFINRANIVSPKTNIGFKTAKQLVADNRGTISVYKKAALIQEGPTLNEFQKMALGISLAAASRVTIDDVLVGEDIGIKLYEYVKDLVIINGSDENGISYLITKELKNKVWDYVDKVKIENRPIIKTIQRESMDHPLRVRDSSHNLLKIKFDSITASNINLDFHIMGGDHYNDQTHMDYKSKIKGLSFEQLSEVCYTITKDELNNNFEIRSFGNNPNESVNFGKYTLKNLKIPYYLRLEPLKFYRSNPENFIRLSNVKYEYDLFINYHDGNGNTISKIQLNEELTDNCVLYISNKLIENLKYHITITSLSNLLPDIIVKHDNLPPIINNVKDRIIPYGMEFDPLTGVTAIDNEDGDLTSELVIEGYVNEYIPGDYNIKYSVTDSSGLTTTRICKITVDNEPNIKPVIYGIEDIKILKDSVFDPMFGVTAYDKEDGNLTNLIEVDDTVDTNVPKSYKVTYSVSDTKGAKTTKVRTVTVSEYIDEEERIEDVIYNAKLTGSSLNNAIKDKVNLYTDTNGDMPVVAEIIDDTGFTVNIGDEIKYTGKLTTPGPYVIKDDYIRCAYAVMCIDAREITLRKPRSNKLLDNWYPGVQFGHSTRVFSYRGVKKKIIYDIPEFNSQLYGTYNRPYVDVLDGETEFIDDHAFKTKLFPLYVRLDSNKKPLNISAYILLSNGEKKPLTIENWLYNEGIIYVKESISEYDTIVANYTYEEDVYTYRGYYDEKGFKDIDLNINTYHNFYDTSIVPNKENKVYNLLNKTIYFFLKPTMIVEDFISDSDQVEVSKVIKRVLINDTNIFPDNISIDAGIFKGTIPKEGSPYVIEGNYRPIETRAFEREKIDLLVNLPEYFNINEDGFYGFIPKFGQPIYISGIESPEESKEFEAEIIQDSNEFPNEYSINEDGYLGFIPKLDSSIQLTGPKEDELYKEVEIINNYQNEEEILEYIEYDDGEYYGILELLDKEQEVIGYNDIRKEDTASVTINSEIHYKWYHNGTWTNSPCDTCEIINPSNGVEYTTNSSYSLELDEFKKLGYSVVGDELIDGSPLFDTSVEVGEDHEQRVYKEIQNVTNLYRIGTFPDYDNPILGKWIATYRGEVVHKEIENRTWKQKYRGLLTKTLPDARKFKQIYKGEVTNEGGDDRVFAQNYKGTLTGFQTAESGLDEVEIIYVVDNSVGINAIRKTIVRSVDKIHASLSDTGVETIRYGLVTLNGTDSKVEFFNSNNLTEDIEVIKDRIRVFLETSYNGAVNSIEAVHKACKQYKLTSNSRHIVLITNSVPNDVSKLYEVTTLAGASATSIHVVTDTNEMHSKTLSVLSNETGGNVCEFVNALWDDQIILAIARISLYGIVTTINKDTIYHKIDDEIPNQKYDLLIGSIFLAHHTSLQSTEIIDARKIGGGIKDEISDKIRKELEIESDNYFDIGYYDGETYCENAVVIIRLDKNILSKNGGRFTEKDVEQIVHRWIAQGTIPIIEYVDIYDSEFINDNLSMDVEPINKIDIKPTISCDIE